MSIRGNGMPKLSKFQWKYLSYMVPLTHWKHNSRCVKTNLRFTFRGLRILELHTKSGTVDFTRPSPKWGRNVWLCHCTFDPSTFLEAFLAFLGMLDVLGGGGGPSGTPSAKFHRSHWSPFQNCQNWSTIFRGWFGLQTPIFEAYAIIFPMILGITIWGCPKVMEVPPVLIHLNVGFSKTIVFWGTPIYGNLHFLANPSITGPPRWVPLASRGTDLNATERACTTRWIRMDRLCL